MRTTVAVLMPSTGRADQLLDRAGKLLRQLPPPGVTMALVLAIPVTDAATWEAANMLDSGVMALGNELHAIERKNGTTAVQGWLMAYEYARLNGAEWFVLGADDIEWKPGWLGEALRVAEETGALVVGLNDGDHTDLNDYAPHYMMHRLYADEHGFIPAGYQSWWFDRDVCQKAQRLGLYAPAWAAVADHKHPDWHAAEMDETYALGMPLRSADQALYYQRKVKGFV